MITQSRSALFILAIVLFCSFSTHAQKANYFPNRLVIKYESDQQLKQIQSKQQIDPRTALTELLNSIGAYKSRPLLSKQLRQTIRQKQLPTANDVLRIHEISFGKQINPIQIAAKISRIPGVEYAEPRYIRYLDETPNDPQLQKYIDTHNFKAAWDLSKGSRNITIAVVDGGVGYTHVELDDNLWVNQDEIPGTIKPQVDQNGNNEVTSTEIKQYLETQNINYNGDGSITLQDALHENSPFVDNIDNDNNNFTDDIFGWDFWSSGQLQGTIISDNDPFHDATDHGTHVAGIAAAETNNGEGIASAAYNATYMPVKTGGAPDDPDAIGLRSWCFICRRKWG